jgi:WD40 repeat protein
VRTRIATTKLSSDGPYLAAFGLVREHKNTVLDAAFCPHSRTPLTSSSDVTARLWAVPDGEILARPLNLRRPVHLVAFTPDGRSIS